MPQIERNAAGEAVALSWAKGETFAQPPPRHKREAPQARPATMPEQRILDFAPAYQTPTQAKAVRLQRKALALLAALRCGPITNLEAIRIGGLRFGARIGELRAAGAVIRTDEDKATGVCTYTLTREAM